ncbi:MAG: prepilin-type N-terminal cleavage/methylation domain-containing protein [Oscillospiraceae bacterium]|nr:prepilin-type N-terminal cleavage/methylation domain-containing protein [Oscillospiraceae bacterium]
MNMFKKNGGFTLVELIVVIAILAILAAIAVPAYSGYISKANEASDYTQLDAVKTAATFAYMEAVVKNDPAGDTDVENVIVTAANASASPAVEFKVVVNSGITGKEMDVTDLIDTYYDSDNFVLKSGAAGATWLLKATDEQKAADLKDGWNLTK